MVVRVKRVYYHFSKQKYLTHKFSAERICLILAAGFFLFFCYSRITHILTSYFKFELNLLSPFHLYLQNHVLNFLLTVARDSVALYGIRRNVLGVKCFIERKLKKGDYCLNYDIFICITISFISFS